MLNTNERIKDFYNLQGYYLRLHLTNQQLSLISYNSNLLDGIKYNISITKTIDVATAIFLNIIFFNMISPI